MKILLISFVLSSVVLQMSALVSDCKDIARISNDSSVLLVAVSDGGGFSHGFYSVSSRHNTVTRFDNADTVRTAKRLSYSTADKTLYWLDEIKVKSLSSACYHSIVLFPDSSTQISDIAVLDRKLYYTAAEKGIYVLDPSIGIPTTVVPANSDQSAFNQATRLALHAATRRMYWTCDRQIYRSWTDGSGVEAWCLATSDVTAITTSVDGSALYVCGVDAVATTITKYSYNRWYTLRRLDGVRCSDLTASQTQVYLVDNDKKSVLSVNLSYPHESHQVYRFYRAVRVAIHNIQLHGVTTRRSTTTATTRISTTTATARISTTTATARISTTTATARISTTTATIRTSPTTATIRISPTTATIRISPTTATTRTRTISTTSYRGGDSSTKPIPAKDEVWKLIAGVTGAGVLFVILVVILGCCVCRCWKKKSLKQRQDSTSTQRTDLSPDRSGMNNPTYDARTQSQDTASSSFQNNGYESRAPELPPRPTVAALGFGKLPFKLPNKPGNVQKNKVKSKPTPDPYESISPSVSTREDYTHLNRKKPAVKPKPKKRGLPPRPQPSGYYQSSFDPPITDYAQIDEHAQTFHEYDYPPDEYLYPINR